MEAAAALFDRLLAVSDSPQQLRALQGLLQGVWREGAALPGGQAAVAQPAVESAAAREGADEAADTRPPDADAADSEQAAAPPPPRVSPLHACWAALFGVAVARGDAGLVVAAFDQLAAAESEQQQQPRQHQHQQALCVPLTGDELAALLASAEASPDGGPALALCLGLLSPFPSQRAAALERLRGAPLPAQGPYAPHLLCALVFRGGFASVSAAATGQQQPTGQPQEQVAFSQLCGLLMRTAPHPALVGGAGPHTELAGGDAAALLPHAVCQLVAAGQLATAAQLAATRLRFHPVLSFFGGAMLVLERFVACAMHAAPEPALATRASDGGAGGRAALLPACCAALRKGAPAAARAAFERLAAATRPPP